MPEIKHQFASGKMNKDLDERLIPNGEYRDAMNIQVSTSEGSDVGTIQNILGNSLVPGQDFIQEGFCVGSIADEKNDKLYYFINSDVELIEDTNLRDATAWTANNPGSPEVGSGKHQFNDNGSYSQLTPNNLILEHGVKYQIEIVVDNIDAGVGIQHNGGSGGYPVLVPASNTGPGTYEATFIADTTSTSMLKLYHNPYGNGASVQVTISSVSLKKVVTSYIIEYDSKTNSITPVLVDRAGDVLKFSNNRLITGINIVDDMLFWTDNHSEPKKINIPRSIQGTDSSGLIHTKFINEDQNISAIDIKEEHITVIKKSPKVSPTIELISERDSDNTYAGVMRVVSNSGNIGEGSSSLRNLNQNGFADLDAPWNIEPFGGQDNFSSFGVGDSFYTFIETDLDGQSGFTLDWNVGDIVVFKEFEIDAQGNETPPAIPITDYTIKAKIVSSVQNVFDDSVTEQLQNGSFEVANANGAFALHWSPDAVGYPSYDSANHKLSYDGVNAGGSWGTVTSAVDWVLGATYKVTIEVSNWTNGYIRPVICAPANFGSSVGGAHNWFMNNITSSGTYEETFTLNYDTGITTAYWSGNNNTFFFHSTNAVSGVETAGMDVEFVSVERLDVLNAGVRLEVLDISRFPSVPQAPYTELKYAVDKFNESEKLFEFKFPRFAYRYQYQDKEYSNISPFSPIAFLPGSFDYHPKKGYNLGMTNRIDKIKIKDFVKNVPNGVVAIDILYKEEVSPNIYVVDTIKPKHSNLSDGGSIWDEDEYIVKSEILKQVLPSNQILRPWDAVPRKALAQDITGNRIVYGNYIQNYNLKYNDEDYYPDFDFTIEGEDAGLNTVKSIKSLREYQLGVVFIDEYGRETPVATNTSGFSNVTKSQSNKQNKASVSFKNSKFPHNMKYFKFFIKETSGEYYNMAMDRWYDAGDDHVWLSFPSSDRNKIDIDSFLILKKGLESNDLIEETARYKILAIENEAPEFIKTRKTLVDEKTHDISVASVTKDVFGSDATFAPLSGRDHFKMKYRPFHDSTGSELHEIKDGELYIQLGAVGNNYVSERYRVSSITTDLDPGNIDADAAFYSIQLDRVLGPDADNIVNDISNPTHVLNGSTIKIYKYDTKNQPKFDGRFFVKVINDESFSSNISINNTREPEFRAITTRKLYYMNRDIAKLHAEGYTGLDTGWYAEGNINVTGTMNGDLAEGVYWDNGNDQWNSDGTQYTMRNTFGRFAPFFRNYKHKDGDFQMLDDTGGFAPDDDSDYNQVMVNVGRFAFGTTSSGYNQPWKFELAYFSGGNNFRNKYRPNNYNADWIYEYYDGPATIDSIKFADNHGYNDAQRAGVFNDEGEQTHGNVWFIDAGPYVGKRGSNDKLHYPWHSQLLWNDASGVETFGLGTGIDTSTGSIEFAVNVYHDEVASKTNDSVSEFFNIGKNGGNPFHNHSKTQDLVGKISSGQQWRWKEDPSGEVYTFVPSQSVQHRKLRWNSDKTPYMIKNQWASGDTYASGWDDGNVDYDISTMPDPVANGQQNQALGQLSPNFTKNYRIKCVNSSGGTSMNWNPTGNDTVGPIEGGLKLSVNHSSVAHTFTAGENYVIIDDIHSIADDNTAVKHSISVGLILETHSNADAGGTFDGSPGKEYLIVSKIEGSGPYNVYLTGYQHVLTDADFPTPGGFPIVAHTIFSDSPAASQAMVFRQPAMNGYSQYSVNRINQQDAVGMGWDINNPGLLAVGYTIEFVEQIFKEPEMPDNPAIWETEPKDTADLAIYYEASGYNPLVLTEDSKFAAIPIGTEPIHVENQGSITSGSLVNSVDYTDEISVIGGQEPNGITGWYLRIENKFNNANPLVGGNYINVGSTLSMTKPDGSVITVTVKGWTEETGNRSGRIFIEENLYGPETSYTLNWHNCFAFGNGVESNRVRDAFNLPFIMNGVKVSTVLEGGYKEEHRKYGLIYSGIYNSTSGINNLNQFIVAEKITKEVNPIYGSIQKLHSRDTDLVTLCEDKILKILANKDAVFNADGNTQLTATENVLGQTVPFVGEYGISTNPESFASEAYRAYFTDRVRGAVMRLSKDGLTPISEHGMKDWFRDNLSLGRVNVLGEDALYDETRWDGAIWQAGGQANSAIRNGEAILGYYNNDVHDSRYGKVARLKMVDVLEIGKTYRIQYDVVEHSGLKHQSGDNSAITVVNMFPGSGWISGAHGGVASQTDGGHVNETWVANTTDFELLHYQVNNTQYHYTPPGGITYPITGFDDGGTPNDDTDDTMYGSVRDYIHAQRIANGAIDSNGDGMPDDAVEESVANVNLTTENDGFVILDNSKVEWDGLSIAYMNTVNYIKNITSSADMEIGATYYITLTVSNYSGTGMMGFSTNANVPFNMRLDGSGTVSGYFVSTGARPDLFATDTNAGTMEVSIQKVISSNISPNYSWFYAGIVRIKNLIVEEVKEDLRIIGSYDDRQDEYNVTIHGTDSNTVSFKEDVKGWVSFKSFTPENAISCANDYYTMKQGKLWQHHNPGANRNTFYSEFVNSSFNAILNDIPSSIKSYHTLDYEGSQSRIEGIKRVEVTGIQHAQGPANDGKYFFFEVLDINALLGNSNWSNTTVEVRQYRNNVLIRTGLAKIFGNTGNSLFPASPSGGPTKGHGRWDSGNSPGDWEVGDVITTLAQENSIHAIGSDLFNSTSKDGWYVSSVETNKEKGSLPEFIEKEGKWFNYIKGVDQTVFNEQIEDYSHLDFGSFEIQGLGIIEEVNLYDITIQGGLNTSLQIGDAIYSQPFNTVLVPKPTPWILDSTNNVTTSISSNALHIVNSGGGISHGSIEQDIALVSGTTYTLSFHVTAISLVGAYVAAFDRSDHQGPATIGYAGGAGTPLAVGLGPWVQTTGFVSNTFTSDGTGGVYINFQTFNDGDSITIDNVILEEASNPGVNLIEDGGFNGVFDTFTNPISIDSNQTQSVGTVSGINGDIITVSGVQLPQMPFQGDYCMFVKNQTINMNGLSGYYADVMFENNSKEKAELFSVSSEITESSK